MADEEGRPPHPLVARVQRIVEWAQQTKPARVFARYGEQRGPLLSAGLSYQAIFSVFAAVWVGFSVFGLVVGGDSELRAALLSTLDAAVPGLIDTGDGEPGAIDPTALFSSAALGWTGALALVGALATAIGWLGAARDAVREIAQLAGAPVNPVLLKLRDLGLALAFGVALIASAALLVLSTPALSWVLAGLGLDESSFAAGLAARALVVALMFGLDAGVLAVLYRVLAGVPIPPRPLAQGALLGALALGALKLLGSLLLGGASANPLLASFAVIVGLLIWFNLVCQVILIGAAWVVVTATDQGVPLDPVGERARREAEARLRLELEEQIRAELEAELPRAVRWLARRRRRREVSEQN